MTEYCIDVLSYRNKNLSPCNKGSRTVLMKDCLQKWLDLTCLTFIGNDFFLLGKLMIVGLKTSFLLLNLREIGKNN